MRGRFITFEGGEGAGKSTQARRLVAELEARGIPALLTREPGGTPGAEAVRSLLLDPPGEGWTREAEALLFAAARADHVARLIEPALADGTWVVCDRFLDSSRAYQGVGGGLGDDAIRALHDFGSGGLLPDRTLILAIPEALASQRIEARDGAESDAIGGRPAEYHRAVNAAFAKLALAEPERFALIDASGTQDTVAKRVMASLGAVLPC